MTEDDWPDRTLCPDGACTGLIGADGACKACGRAAPFWGDERRRGMLTAEPAATGDLGPPDVDADDRQLCPDGACTGVIGPDGACKVCGRRAVPRVVRVVPPAPVVGAPADDDSDDRRLCPDGACTGLLDAAGVCKVCGRTDVGN